MADFSKTMDDLEKQGMDSRSAYFETMKTIKDQKEQKQEQERQTHLERQEQLAQMRQARLTALDQQNRLRQARLERLEQRNQTNKTQPPRVGRPLDGLEPKSVALGLRCTPDQAERWKAVAKERGMSLNSLIGAACDEFTK